MNTALLLILIVSPLTLASEPVKQGCCFPEDFHGRWLVVDTGVSIFYRVDYNKNLILLFDDVEGGEETFNVTDVGSLKTYVIKDKKCRIKKWEHFKFFSKCIGPPKSKYAFGTSKDIYPVSFYSSVKGNIKSSMILQNDKGKCIPIMADFYHIGGSDFRALFFYDNRTPEFPDMEKVKKLCNDKA